MDKRLFCLLITTATVVATVPVPAPTPAPADDCTWAFSKVTDCTTYLLNGSADDDPSAPCCGGVTSIVKTAPECICTVVEMASHLGLSLNMTRLLHLPQVCKVSLPPGVGDCDVDFSPSPSPSIIPPSPAPAPGTPPTPPVAEPPTPGTSPTPPVAEPPTTTPPSSPAPPVDEPPTPNPPSPPLASESSTSSSKLQSGSFMVLISLAVAGLSISHF
ncbi:hypothetical protein HPP92_019315 [Vanilla planifolia]|uniref:Bifunctional inhibitor/plant lipid transfer protein/seed storage helical domain-containing protein n=1 Tax=Vanilla planifolia TaxID=51239 RepID=A0A835Q7C8_VANPL|nr:hypothetical protein HPP92_019315 [Vanilla planifolia]